MLDVYLAREDADPEVTGALVADAVPLPAERVAYVAGLRRVPAELLAARPGPATWCSPSAPAPSPPRARRCSSCCGRCDARARPRADRAAASAPVASGSPAGSGPAAGWRWRSVARRARCWSSLVGASVWLVFFSATAAGQARRRRGHRACSATRRSASAADVPARRRSSPASTSTASARGSRRCAAVKSVDVIAHVARQRTDPVVERKPWPWSSSAAACAASTPTAWCSATTQARPQDLPRVRAGGDAGTRRPRGGRDRGRRRCRTTSRARSTRRGRDRRPDHPGPARRAARCCGGARRSPPSRPTVARRAAAGADGDGATTSASRASPTSRS